MQEENNRKISICVEKHTLEHKRKRIRKLDILVKNRRKLKSIKKAIYPRQPIFLLTLNLIL